MHLPHVSRPPRRLSAGLTGALILLTTLGDGVAAAPGPDARVGHAQAEVLVRPPPHTLFDVRDLTLTLPNGDEADVYLPRIAPPATRRFQNAFPLVAVLQGANVDRSHYQHLGNAIARQGFVVVIPNHFRTFPGYGRVLFSEVGVVNEVWTAMVAEDGNPASPLRGIIDTDRMGLIGHSLGGSVGLYAIAGVCAPAICSQFAPGYVYQPPAALRAAAVYGASLVGVDGSVTDLDTSGAAVALIQGSLDGVAAPGKTAPTYGVLESPRAAIEIEGANHYGICDENNPAGAGPDPNVPSLSQADAVDTTARWIGLWLREQIQDDHPGRH